MGEDEEEENENLTLGPSSCTPVEKRTSAAALLSDTADEEGVSQSQFHRTETYRGDKICGVRGDCA